LQQEVKDIEEKLQKQATLIKKIEATEEQINTLKKYRDCKPDLLQEQPFVFCLYDKESRDIRIIPTEIEEIINFLKNIPYEDKVQQYLWFAQTGLLQSAEWSKISQSEIFDQEQQNEIERIEKYATKEEKYIKEAIIAITQQETISKIQQAEALYLCYLLIYPNKTVVKDPNFANDLKEITQKMLEKEETKDFGENLKAYFDDYIQECTNLHKAVKKDNLSAVKLLLEQEIDIDAKNNNEETALYMASSRGNRQIVKLLLEQGADINVKNDNHHYTALHIAAYFDKIEILKLLLEQEKINLEARSKKGSSPLLVASYIGNLEVAKILLEKGADINAKNDNGETALHMASHENHQQIVELLLEQEKINLEARSKKGSSPLLVAVYMGNLEIAKLLLEKGADINAKNDNGETALHMASSRGHKQIEKLLLEQGINVASSPKGIAKVMSYINCVFSYSRHRS